MFYQLSRVFAFATIKHEDLNPFLRRVPFVIAMLLALGFTALPVAPRVFGEGSLSRHMITIFAILPGFYIAALAAVATFNREEVDFVMPDPAPTLKMKTAGQVTDVELTFRMFVSQLFAYLTGTSFLAVFIFVSADLSAPSIKHLIEAIPEEGIRDATLLFVRFLYVVVVCWLASKIVITTLLGLHFLAERIHRPSA